MQGCILDPSQTDVWPCEGCDRRSGRSHAGTAGEGGGQLIVRAGSRLEGYCRDRPVGGHVPCVDEDT
jgi:hypothetical protein